MKQFVLLFGILNLYALGFSQTYLIEGNAFLEGTSDHSNIAITFNRTAPTPLSYMVFTDTAGYFSDTIEEGIYDITYEKNGYTTITTNDNSIYSATVLSDTTLELQGLSGDIAGTLSAGTYKVSGDITVPEGYTLTIEPGTILKFKQNINFIIRGVLYANGTINDSIIFERFDNGITWGGISIYNADSSVFSYVKISYANTSGIYIGGNCTIDHSSICNNTGNHGGGIEIAAAEKLVFITNTRICQNTGTQGGGIYFGLSTNSSTYPERPVISNCLIYNNTANLGAGIYFYLWYYAGVRSPLITNCVFFYNTCLNGSSGVLDCDPDSGMPTIVNNIISNNVGFGTKFTSNTQYFGFNNSFNNTLGNYYNSPSNVGNNVTITINGDSCDAYHNIQLDPMFIDENNYNLHLLPESPCIDVGLNDSVYCDLDFDDNIRIWDGNNFGNPVVDMGPYEFGSLVNVKEFNNTPNRIICYPNPTDCIVNFKFADIKIQQIIITDITGKILINKITKMQNKSIDLSGFESGIYLISIRTDKGIFTRQVVKK